MPAVVVGTIIFSRRRKVPVVGVHGAGKSCLLLSMAYVVSKMGWGHVNTESMDYFNSALRYVLAGQQLPPTVATQDIRIIVKDMEIDERKYRPFVLSSSDYSGAMFERVMEEYRLMDRQVPVADETASFLKLFERSSCLVVVIDLVRGLGAEEFRADIEAGMRKAFSEQLVPVSRAIEHAVARRGLSNRPVMFVFSKADLHGLTVDEIRPYFDRVMAITLGRLRRLGTPVNLYTTVATGWGRDTTEDQWLHALEAKGVTDLLTGIARAVA